MRSTQTVFFRTYLLILEAIARSLNKKVRKEFFGKMIKLYVGGDIATLVRSDKKFLCVDISQDVDKVMFGPDFKRFNKNNFSPATDGLIRKGTIVFDIGSSHGSEAMHFAELVGDDGLVIAVDPNPISFRAIKMTLERNNVKNVLPLNFGIGGKAGYFELDSAGWESLQVLDESSENGIEVKTLDSIYDEFGQGKEVSFVKIDTDGFELDVIEGSGELIKRFPNVNILSEYSPKISYSGFLGVETLKEYKKRGFSIYKIQPQLSELSEEGFQQFSDQVDKPINMICHDIVLKVDSSN